LWRDYTKEQPRGKVIRLIGCVRLLLLDLSLTIFYYLAFTLCHTRSIGRRVHLIDFVVLRLHYMPKIEAHALAWACSQAIWIRSDDPLPPIRSPSRRAVHWGIGSSLDPLCCSCCSRRHTHRACRIVCSRIYGVVSLGITSLYHSDAWSRSTSGCCPHGRSRWWREPDTTWWHTVYAARVCCYG